MVDGGTTIMEAVVKAGAELEGPCGGKGTCRKCRIKIQSGGPAKADKNSEVAMPEAKDEVLACQTKIQSDVVVVITQLDVSVHRKSGLAGNQEFPVPLEPGICKTFIKLASPTLADQAADVERLAQGLGVASSGFTLGALRGLPSALRKGKFSVTAVMQGNRIMAVEAGDTTERLFGLAVDIGTTTIVASLVDLHRGDTLGTVSATNTQNILGADVIARIEHATQKEGGLRRLNRRVVDVLNRLILKLSEMARVKSEEILLVSVVGNTTMSHLFLGLDPGALANAPFIPVFVQPVESEARDLGLTVHPSAPVCVLPNIAGYVGADTMGVILATRLWELPGVSLAIDIGTNGEIVLAVDGKLSTCSTAAGPAFEGAQIRYGMRAATGAIEGVRIEDDVRLDVIGDAPVKGICGSGLIDAVAELVRSGVVESSGRLLKPDEASHLSEALRHRLGEGPDGGYFVLAKGEPELGENVVLTQKDIRELQLAKGAVAAGIRVLLAEAGVSYHDVDRLFLAGAFGNYIKKEQALAIGLLPPVEEQRVRAVGNAAGDGAKLALLSAREREFAVGLARQVRHIELSTRMDFQEYFVECLALSNY